MQFANTSVSNHSVMNSLALETTVPEGGGNGTNYGNPRHRFEDVSSAASLATTDTRTGFNMKQVCPLHNYLLQRVMIIYLPAQHLNQPKVKGMDMT